MDVRCEKCATEYEFDDNRVGPNGVTVKCTNCGHVFKVRRPAARAAIPRATTTIGAGPQGREWLVKKPDAQMIAFRELTTLQKWIVEGRISRDDEISKNGETWKRLGNIMELEPFFSVYEKAQTLNSLIEQQPALELRGSELLAAVSPLEGAPQSGPQYPIPSRSQIVQADPVPSQRPSPAPYPSQDIISPPPLPAGGPRSAPANASPAAERGAAFDTGLAGPGALEHRSVEPAAPPASFASATLDFPASSPSEEVEADPVETFQRGQRRQRGLLAGVLVVCLALGASAAVAMYGPPDNPLRVLAVQYGLLEGPAVDDGAGAKIEAARRDADLDSEAALARALAQLDEAAKLRPGSAEIAADRALFAALLALRHAQLAAALEAEVAQAAATEGAAEPKQAKSEAKRHRTAQEARLREAALAVEAAERAAPEAFATQRARAAVAMAADADDRTERLDAALAAAKAAQRADPWLAYLSAEQLDTSTPEGRAEAQGSLARALTARPTFQRARVMQARLHLEAGELAEAKASAQPVLQAVEDHAVARRVLDAATEAEAKAAAEPEPEPEPEEAAPAPAAEPEEEAPPRGFDYWMSRGDRLRRRDRTTAALNAYGRAAELKPKSAEVHVGKGWCLLDLDRPHPALVSFDRAIGVNNRYAEAYYGRGEALRRIGEKGAALKAYEEYLRRAPKGAERRVAERRVAELSSATAGAE